jgi:hypothetical protein
MEATLSLEDIVMDYGNRLGEAVRIHDQRKNDLLTKAGNLISPLAPVVAGLNKHTAEFCPGSTIRQGEIMTDVTQGSVTYRFVMDDGEDEGRFDLVSDGTVVEYLGVPYSPSQFPQLAKRLADDVLDFFKP